MLRNVLQNIRKLDAYPKTLEDFRVKTVTGATVTIASCILASILFLSELSYYLTPQVSQQLLVDVSKGERLRINFDLSFPHLTCPSLAVDSIDVSGLQSINILHDIYKIKLDANGQPIDDAKKDDSLDKSKQTKAILGSSTTVKPTLDPNRCESCYGAESPSRKCCNTCDEVKEAYHGKGWALNDLSSIVQCRREGLGEQSKEGCKIYGFVEVARVSGNLHIAPGRSFDSDHRHVHDLTGLGGNFNTSHIINHLSFVTDDPSHLDGSKHIAQQAMASFRYYIKVVSSIYVHLNGTTVPKSDFAVTIHESSSADGEGGPPGVYFVYEFAPMMVKYTEHDRPFLHFLTSVCAIIGGVFSVASLVDSLIYLSLRKIQLTKLS